MKILFSNAEHELYESWAEVPVEKIPALVELAYFAPDAGSTHLEIVRQVLGIKPRPWARMLSTHFAETLPTKVREANAENINWLVRQCAWMWNEPLTKMPFEYFEHKGVRYYIAKSSEELAFETCSYGELTNAYINMQGFVKRLKNDDYYLNNLVAVLCRERRSEAQNDKDWNGDVRVPYNEYLCTETAKLFDDLDVKIKLAVMMYFAGNLKRFMDGYQQTFRRGDGEGEEYIGQGFLKNQHLLAEKGIFGDIYKTKNANCHEVMLYLEEYGADMEKQMLAMKAQGQ